MLSNDPGAPRDLREKSLRLAAHLLEYDPELRGGTGYARARELLDSGAALKQMQKIIDAQGPSICRTDLGTLTADVPASSDGVISGIDCLRLNRLARTAGAPIDKGAGIKIFKKIGDRVEKGEPLYRIYAFDQSEYDLAVAAAKADTGYVIDGQQPLRSEAHTVSGVAIQCLPSSASDAARLASRLGVPLHEIAVHRFPDGELRVTVGPAAPTTIIYAPLDRPNDKLIALLFAAEALRRDGAEAARSGGAVSLLHASGRGFPAAAKRSARRSSAGCWPERVDRVITVDAHLHRTAEYRERLSGHRGRQSVGHAGNRRRAAHRRTRSRGRSWSGPDAESRPWVSDLAGRLGVAHAVAQKDTPQRPLGRDRIRRPKAVRGPARFVGRRHCLVRGHADRLRKGARGGGRRIDRRHRYACAVPGGVGRRVCPRRHSFHPIDPQRAASDQRDHARRHIRGGLAQRVARCRPLKKRIMSAIVRFCGQCAPPRRPKQGADRKGSDLGRNSEGGWGSRIRT